MRLINADDLVLQLNGKILKLSSGDKILDKIRLKAFKDVVGLVNVQPVLDMDRVVVPRQVMTFATPTEYFNVGDMLGRCKCGKNLDSALMNFCPNCGRKILWEKVTNNA